MRLLVLLTVVLLVLLALWLPTPAMAAKLINPGGAANVILWKSEDAYEGCSAERRATQKFGPICLSGALALVPVGTPVRLISGWIFLKIQILDGQHVGKIGYTPVEYVKP